MRTGYLRREEIIQSAVEIYAEEVRHADLAGAVGRCSEELSAQQRREGDWKSPTDCDRLDRAFAQLEKWDRCATELQRLRDVRSGGD